jgi:hypothetical protein
LQGYTAGSWIGIFVIERKSHAIAGNCQFDFQILQPFFSDLQPTFFAGNLKAETRLYRQRRWMPARLFLDEA